MQTATPDTLLIVDQHFTGSVELAWAKSLQIVVIARLAFMFSMTNGSSN
jgi:hypothetical protein